MISCLIKLRAGIRSVIGSNIDRVAWKAVQGGLYEKHWEESYSQSA